MGLIADATYFHMELTSGVDRIQRLLHRYRRASADPEERRELVDGLVTITDRLADLLRIHLGRERRDLFPRVDRIISHDLEEIAELDTAGHRLLETLSTFRKECLALLEEESVHMPVRVVYLEMIFEEFVERYEARRDAEMAFYRTVATLLYPGGLSAD